MWWADIFWRSTFEINYLSIREEQGELKCHLSVMILVVWQLGDAQVMAPRLRSLAALCVLPALTSGGTVIQYDALCVWLFLTRESCHCSWKGLVSCKVPLCKWSKARYVLAEEVQDSEQIAHDCTTYQIDSRELEDRRCECFRCMNPGQPVYVVSLQVLGQCHEMGSGRSCNAGISEKGSDGDEAANGPMWMIVNILWLARHIIRLPKLNLTQ